MKRKLTLILAVLLVLALFAGCDTGKNDKTNTSGSTGDNTPPATSTPAPTSAPTPTEEPSPYNYAVGKYDVDSAGWPTAKYEYELPLSTTGEKFTMWTICWSAQYLPENGYDGVSMYKGMQEKTGVDIEFFLVASAARAENFSVLVNSDSLCDIMSGAASYWKSGSLLSAVEDGYFANFYEYKDYLPNYCYEIYSRSKTLTDSQLMKIAFYKPDVWITMYGLFEKPIQNTGYMLRQDWMEDLGLGKAKDVKTFDQFHNVLTAFKAAKSDIEGFWPMMIQSAFELAPYNWCGYNTTPYSGGLSYNRVVDGKVQFCGTTKDDLALFTLLNKWWNEGLIDANYSKYTAGSTALSPAMVNNKLGCTIAPPNAVKSNEDKCIEKGCIWENTPRLRQSTNQIIHWGFSTGSTNYGQACFSAKCKNLPLLMTYMDWQYSDSGSDWTNWGPEGELWKYDANGKRMLTEFAITHPAGTSWLQNAFAYNEMADAGIQHWMRNYAYPGGERYIAMFDTWDVSSFYDGAYVWPKGLKFTDEQSSDIAKYKTDPNTYYTENIIKFFTGDLPFSEWDNYVKNMMDMGLSKVLEIYQEAYDNYIKQ